MKYSGHTATHQSGGITIYNADCMSILAQTPDKYYDICIVDPPYGIGESGGKARTRGKKDANHERKEWDFCRPSEMYFSELQRVSVNQIIWGGNYFADLLRASKCWVCWDKKLDNSDFSDFELAWTSFATGSKFIRYSKNGGSRTPDALACIIHPCQKPQKLYDFLLTTYAKPGQRILDTHLGSGSSAIAAHYFGCDFVGCELDADYYAAAVNRFNQETRQQAMAI